jgi:hypothetical protein
MDGFTTEDLANRTADVLAVADEVAVEVTHSDEHRYVVMSREQYDRLRSATRRSYRLEEIPDELLSEIVTQLAEYCEDPTKPE